MYFVVLLAASYRSSTIAKMADVAAVKIARSIEILNARNDSNGVVVIENVANVVVGQFVIADYRRETNKISGGMRDIAGSEYRDATFTCSGESISELSEPLVVLS